mgnify:CR=1 FL=1
MIWLKVVEVSDMAKSSGGGGRGGGIKTVGKWVNFKEGKASIGVIFNKPFNNNGQKIYGVGISASQKTKTLFRGTVYFNPKSKSLYGSMFDLKRGQTQPPDGDLTRWVIQAAKQ